MALLICTDCQGTVSSNAMTCVHCGNVLRKDAPGFLGSVLRFFYAVFTILVVIVAVLLLQGAGGYGSASVVFVPLGAFGLWFVVSVALAVLLYVTRSGKIVRVNGASMAHQPANP